MRTLRILDLCATGLVKYADGCGLQRALVEQRRAGAVPDCLVLLQHKPVYTLGKRGQHADFRVPVEELVARGVDVEVAPRGGEVTYHGPGQLVAYPILHLRALGLGARTYVEGLEDCVTRVLAHYGIEGRGRVPGATGVWVGSNKIAAIGVKISHSYCSHGFALNVGGASLLPAFEAIVPCGIKAAGQGVTSVEAEVARAGQRRQHAAAEQRAAPGVAAPLASSSTGGGSSSCSGAGGSGRSAAGQEEGLTGLSVAEVAGRVGDEFARHFGYGAVERGLPSDVH